MGLNVRTVRSLMGPRDRDRVIRDAALSRDALWGLARIMAAVPLKGTDADRVRGMARLPITAGVRDRAADPPRETATAVPAVRAVRVNLPAVPANI